MTTTPNRRVLIVDDNPAIHQDFRKILGTSVGAESSPASAAESALFDDEPASTAPTTQPAAAPGAETLEYAIDSAMQGQEALERVQAARKEELPYAMAFLDVRMPPGWDGVETAKRLWEVEPDLQVVICTAFSDYSWQETVALLGRTDRLLILKKPFDRVEVCQLAAALTEKWNVTQRERESLKTAIRAEMEARAYAASLETTNRALETAWAQSERELTRRREFFLQLAANVLAPAHLVLLQELEAAHVGQGRSQQLHRLERLLDPALSVVSAISATLELSALDSGSAKPNWSECDPHALARELADASRDTAQARGIALEVRCSPHAAKRVETDPARLRRVLEELLANALRHATKGHVTLDLDEDPEIPSCLRFSVTDDGAGVSDTALSHIFEPFNPAASSGAAPRAGLGLALCKRTAALLRARLDCENVAPHGARFTLALPVQADTSR
ncbi:MAG: response regulator [Planctomycetes bacterium]|nr:response regulator [Planctomycetota bacterium]